MILEGSVELDKLKTQKRCAMNKTVLENLGHTNKETNEQSHVWRHASALPKNLPKKTTTTYYLIHVQNSRYDIN